MTSSKAGCIDVAYREAAIDENRAITNIRQSYRDNAIATEKRLKQYTVYVPYKDIQGCEYMFRGFYTLALLHKGKLVIDKLLCNKTLYSIAEPFVCEEYSVYAMFHNNASFLGFVGLPAFGFHSEEYGNLCIGAMTVNVVQLGQDYTYAQAVGQEIHKLFAVANRDSFLNGAQYPNNKVSGAIKYDSIPKLLEKKIISVCKDSNVFTTRRLEEKK